MKPFKSSVVIGLLLAVLGLGACQPASEPHAGPASSPSASDSDAKQWHGWSETQPEINLSHIFQGEINRRGKATGFHSRPGGQDPHGARVSQIKGQPNRVGVYTAQVEVLDPDTGQWKSKFSSMYPDSMSQQQVVDGILHAWQRRDPNRQRPWRGPSGQGFQIEGYLSSRGGINTAYPIYQRD